MPLMKRLDSGLEKILPSSIASLIPRLEEYRCGRVVRESPSEDRKIDLGDTLKLPVVRMCENLGIDRFDVFNRTMNEFFAKLVVIAVLFLVLDEDAEGIVELLRLVQLPLVEELNAHFRFSRRREPRGFTGFG